MIPERFKIGRRTWKVSFVDQDTLDDIAGKYGYEKCEGLCVSSGDIYILEDMEGERLQEIFWHEWGHAFCFTHGRRVPHKMIYQLGEALGPMIWLHYLGGDP